MEHSISLNNRSSLTISGVEHIYSFSDKKVEIRTTSGDMIVDGENLDMSKLSIDEKVITVTGTINGINYSKAKEPQENFFKKLFK